MKHRKGFTLIELLLVISIIALLSSIVLSQTTMARRRARDVRRVQDLKELQKAVEIYRTNNDTYPSTGGEWWTGGNCTLAGATTNKGYGDSGYVPGIVPGQISTLPEDPAPDLALGRCYSYKSNGSDYMILANKGLEVDNHTLAQYIHGTDGIAVFTEGARAW